MRPSKAKTSVQDCYFILRPNHLVLSLEDQRVIPATNVVVLLIVPRDYKPGVVLVTVIVIN